jgi:recombinational DNA repair protein (RecF pathway)
MRHKYDTHGIVLSRAPLGEANASIILLTPGFGLIRARAQGVRRPGAKLAPALITYAESSVILVRGAEGWRITGALLRENWFRRLARASARAVAARIAGLLLRLAAADVRDPALFSIIVEFFEALSVTPQEHYEAIEILAALRLLSVLGLDAGDIPGNSSGFTASHIDTIESAKSLYVARINIGIAASGL